jgi:HlyD family secretion protein/epimerase transport system membrane fusion protein
MTAPVLRAVAATLRLAPCASPAGEMPPLMGELRRSTIAATLVIGLGLGGFGVWAVAAPLAGAAIAPGVVSPDGSRRTVQHLEGGIIRRILVEDGSIVQAGDPLIDLEDVQARAGHDVLQARFHTLAAAQARLLAEQAGADDIRFPDWLIEATADDATALEAMVAQRQLFRTRVQGLADRRAILAQRIAQLREEIAGLEAQIVTDGRQIALIADEIEGLDLLYRKGLAPKTRLLALQREQSDIEGERAERRARIARARQAIGETELQIIAQGTAFLDDTNEELSEVQAELAEVEQRLAASRDVLARTVISAPSAGTVVELRFHTPGGVIRPGEPVLDIVPADEELLVDARLSPLDIDIVAPGMPAQIILPAFKQRHLPRIEGRVRQVSADVIVDPHSGERYFEARIEVDAEQLAGIQPAIELSPGMPAEVYITTAERTMLDYLLQPVFDSLRRAFRES